MRVLPVPGGPNSSRPFGGPLKVDKVGLIAFKVRYGTEFSVRYRLRNMIQLKKGELSRLSACIFPSDM